MMRTVTQRFTSGIAALTVTAAMTIAACGGQIDPGAAASADDDAARDVPTEPGRSHLLPVHKPGTRVAQSAPAGAHLTYYGGPVISNVKVVTVYWNSSVANQAALNSFYGGVTNSPYLDWFTEFNTSTQTIGRGQLFGSYVDNQTSTSVTDAMVQSRLNALITAGSVPAPDNNTYYAFHFPSGVSITDSGGSKSCVVFCAYHGTYTRNGQYVYYGIMPDMSGGCATGCGSSTAFNNLTAVSAHELSEAITDPAVGLATTYSAPLAWYDQTNGEITDICGSQVGSIVGGNGVTYNVAKNFSNVANDCIITRSTTTTNDFSINASPSSQSVNAGSQVSYTITTALTTGSAQTINLTVSGLPAGVTGTFSPTSVSSGGSATLTLSAASTAASATATFTVTGTGTSATHTASASITVVGSGGGGGGSELLTNGGFEGSTTPWVLAGNTYYNNGSGYPHSGTGYITEGAYNSASGTLYQQITIPSTATGSLSFWFNATTQETTTTTQYDKLYVEIRNSSGTLLKTVTTYSNLNSSAAGSYAQKGPFDISAYKGQTVRIQFRATTDSSLPTNFRIDDVSVK